MSKTNSKKRDNPIVLTGFMSSGKTTVANALGNRLNCSVVDLDSAIAAAEGRTPAEIIEQDGEEIFRSIETRVLRDVLEAGADEIIALGGGTWIRLENQQLISRHKGISVWLDAPFELCWRRISDGGIRRPLAINYKQSSELYRARAELYQLANIRIPISANTSLNDIVEDIEKALNKWQGPSGKQ